MARHPKIEYEGAFYHVTSRGNLRSNIFFEDTNREKFIEILKRTKERYKYVLHDYVLMDNHNHLSIETPLASLNQLMQNINTSYTVLINRKYRRSMHLFQGRYKAIAVDKDNYLLSLSRYIHLTLVGLTLWILQNRTGGVVTGNMLVISGVCLCILPTHYHAFLIIRK